MCKNKYAHTYTNTNYTRGPFLTVCYYASVSFLFLFPLLIVTVNIFSIAAISFLTPSFQPFLSKFVSKLL